jgi:hypothetical protein
VVAAIIVSLGRGEAAELRTKQHQGVLKKTALTQVGQQCRSGLIDPAALVDEALVKIGVVIPSRLADFDETYASLDFRALYSDVSELLSLACSGMGSDESLLPGTEVM